MNQTTLLAFMDEMSKIAEVSTTCKLCGKKKDTRMGVCYDCATKKEKTSTPLDAEGLAKARAYGGKKSKNSTKYHWAKEKKSCGDMLQYFADHPDKLKAKQERDKKKHAGFMQNVGARISSTAAGMAKNFGGTMEQMFSHPIQGVRKGAIETVKGLKGHPVLSAGLLAGTALGVHDLTKIVDPSGAGRSRAHRTAEFIGDQAGGLIGAPFGFTGSIAGGMVGKRIGDMVGKGIDKIRGYQRAPAMVQPAAAGPQR